MRGVSNNLLDTPFFLGSVVNSGGRTYKAVIAKNCIRRLHWYALMLYAILWRSTFVYHPRWYPRLQYRTPRRSITSGRCPRWGMVAINSPQPPRMPRLGMTSWFILHRLLRLSLLLLLYYYTYIGIKCGFIKKNDKFWKFFKKLFGE